MGTFIVRQGCHFLSRLHENLSYIQSSVNEIPIPAEIEYLHLCICLLHKVEAGILINLVVDIEPTVRTRYYVIQMLMGGYNIQVICCLY